MDPVLGSAGAAACMHCIGPAPPARLPLVSAHRLRGPQTLPTGGPPHQAKSRRWSLLLPQQSLGRLALLPASWLISGALPVVESRQGIQKSDAEFPRQPEKSGFRTTGGSSPHWDSWAGCCHYGTPKMARNGYRTDRRKLLTDQHLSAPAAAGTRLALLGLRIGAAASLVACGLYRLPQPCASNDLRVFRSAGNASRIVRRLATAAADTSSLRRAVSSRPHHSKERCVPIEHRLAKFALQPPASPLGRAFSSAAY